MRVGYCLLPFFTANHSHTVQFTSGAKLLESSVRVELQHGPLLDSSIVSNMGEMDLLDT